MADPTDPRLAAALRRLERGIAPFLDQIAPMLDRIERTLPADLKRAYVVNPLAEAVMAVYSGVGRSDQARLDAVYDLLDWLGAPPVAKPRCRLLLGALRRDGVPPAGRARALRERLAASLVQALETALADLDAAVFRQPDVLRRALRSRLATEVSADLLDRQAKPASPVTPRAEFEAYRRAAQEVADDHDHRRDLGTARRLVAGARLSPRERTVADLMAKGRSDAEIARRLRITEPTVRVLRHRITQKLKTRGTILS